MKNNCIILLVAHSIYNLLFHSVEEKNKRKSEAAEKKKLKEDKVKEPEDKAKETEVNIFFIVLI